MVMLPVYHYRKFLETIHDEAISEYPFCGVLLYTHAGGLQQVVHESVVDRWDRLNHLTGPNFLVMAVERVWGAADIELFSQDDVFDIGRYLGVQPHQLPCLVLFAGPRSHNDTLILNLREFLPPLSEINDADLTGLFETLSSLAAVCISGSDVTRLGCLGRAINQEWPRTSRLSV
jgi:hypothetical protein